MRYDRDRDYSNFPNSPYYEDKDEVCPVCGGFGEIKLPNDEPGDETVCFERCSYCTGEGYVKPEKN